MKTQTLSQRREARNIILGAAALLYAVSFTLPPRDEPPPTVDALIAAGVKPATATTRREITESDPTPPLAEGIDYSDEVRPYREPLEEWEEK